MFANDTPAKFLRTRTLVTHEVRRNSMDALDVSGHPRGVEVRLHRSVDEFRAVAEPFYRLDPVTHTIELTLLRSRSLPDDSLLLTVWNDQEVIGAAIQTPPYPLLCNAIPLESVRAVADAVARTRPDLNGVRGAREAAVAFADAWYVVTGRSGDVTMEERLYRLGTLRAPSAVPGAYRAATDADRDVLVDWMEKFTFEVFGHLHDANAGEQFVDDARDNGDQFLLWGVDSTPVSTAMLRAPAAGVSRIGPVYTPSDRRGRGFGSAVTAAAAQLARQTGAADVVLFTDLANPVSNAIYQRIGFEPVADSVRIDFRTLA